MVKQNLGAKGVDLQGQPGAHPGLILMGLLMGLVRGLVRGTRRRPTDLPTPLTGVIDAEPQRQTAGYRARA